MKRQAVTLLAILLCGSLFAFIGVLVGRIGGTQSVQAQEGLFSPAQSGDSSKQESDTVQTNNSSKVTGQVSAVKDRKLPKLNGSEITSLDMVATGDVITFGVYEQDNDFSNGSESLQWRVLKKSGKRMLLITEKIIDVMPFNETYDKVRWRTSTIRAWLNGEFLNETFSEEERNLIPEVKLLDSGNDYYGVSAGSETVDRVFLLQMDEALSLFKSNDERKADSTWYADVRGFAENSNGWWWLRNSGKGVGHVALVYKSGSVYKAGDRMNRKNIGVRPAIWVELP